MDTLNTFLQCYSLPLSTLWMESALNFVSLYLAAVIHPGCILEAIAKILVKSKPTPLSLMSISQDVIGIVTVELMLQHQTV